VVLAQRHLLNTDTTKLVCKQEPPRRCVRLRRGLADDRHRLVVDARGVVLARKHSLDALPCSCNTRTRKHAASQSRVDDISVGRARPPLKHTKGMGVV
jgi:hypothetical protein